MQQFIKRSEAVKLIYRGDVFDLEFITADRKRGTGGDLILVQGWQMVASGQQDGPKAKGVPRMPNHPPMPDHHRTPNHDEHGTINIHNPGNREGQPRKIHIDLIQTFNGKRILNG